MRTDQEKIKHDYLIQNLKRGFGKPMETFVISSFCLDIRLRNLKPIFQHPIRKDGLESAYLYDLYYPDLKVIVEVDEDHHEGTKTEDEKKESHARTMIPGLHFFRIRFHESHASLIDQIENTKSKILCIAKEIGEDKVRWVENQFNVEDTISSLSKTVVVSISRNKSFGSLCDFPLQIPEKYTQVPDLNIIYLTGNTGTVAGAFLVQPADWRDRGSGNLRHNGTPNPEHPILQSGSTFYRRNNNILYSADLK